MREKGAKQVMKAKCVCNIHNVVMFSIDTTVIRLNTISTLIMTPKMNNNDRKNLSKTIAMAGMGFLLIAGAFTFSFANSGQQLVYAQQSTFTGSGVITATIQGGQQEGGGGGGNQTAGGGGGGNQTAGGGGTTGGGGGGQESPYILGGNWNLNVEGGNVTDFTANIMMVHTDGSGYHTHNITNFNVGNTTVQLIQGQETSMSGSADIYTNGTIKWPGSDTTLTLTPNGTVMTIMPAAEDTDNHFQGQPIYGIASQITGENGTMIAQTTPPGQQQQQEEGGGGPLSGLFGGDQEGGQQQGGNQSGGGGPLSGLTEPFQDLFGGGQ
ncbi:MAG TPA: hypothetical protein VJL79_02575 [Nitrososphaera sp.]|nr:hypothetical protein [Nitrososphaera sp.]